MQIIWRQRARMSLAKIIRYISNEDPKAAQAILERLQSAILPVADHPYLYRPGRVAGTRELVAHPNYVLVYRVTLERIEVVNVIHARQEYPSL
ncbi:MULTISPECIES: type II toxin-antitoxin system RelE/ParE family toxin [Pseudomonas syringae group]|uniref:Stability determinant n=8 Tax=Pseudomonas syringae group TaxID=136849 RepID=A0A0P9R5Y3_PSESG|nr:MULTISPECIES: type II toxin-antitoxin system RelE/ParE family toxin [Pseudomonas syringae group]AAT35212.1 putative stability determinant [Pseudomonas syringae pv. maculicola]EFW77227.1 putative stability determinant [Pseudomonas savastanoi pv. glycinea str. B076]EFW82815.1 putative stability determinant [Pseudomonas savastanoi pv. glycinea str. race 4]EGH16754.1 putative stability determinant [Pseudomonas savastanoi pv. glycinea str. race 4]KPC31105.1 putative stability determinant [Pseudo